MLGETNEQYCNNVFMSVTISRSYGLCFENNFSAFCCTITIACDMAHESESKYTTTSVFYSLTNKSVS